MNSEKSENFRKILKLYLKARKNKKNGKISSGTTEWLKNCFLKVLI